VKNRAILALGGNLGDKRATLEAAIIALDSTPGIKVKARSSLYETVALTLQGLDSEQPSYLNAAVEINTSLTPKKLLAAIHEIENQFGRIRLARWAPRTLDIDIITYGTQLIETKNLIVPHPRAFERSFVLVPWLEIEPEAILPGRGRISELVTELQETVVVAR
jgi:2-amino-4-hydroxy-6-hydroxymethyldihydropteridine diphosphokinase